MAQPREVSVRAVCPPHERAKKELLLPVFKRFCLWLCTLGHRLARFLLRASDSHYAPCGPHDNCLSVALFTDRTLLLSWQKQPPQGRLGVFSLLTLSCGYTFGPINVVFPNLIAVPLFGTFFSVMTGAVVATSMSTTRLAGAVHAQVFSATLGSYVLAEVHRRVPSPVEPQVWSIAQVLMTGALTGYAWYRCAAIDRLDAQGNHLSSCSLRR